MQSIPLQTQKIIYALVFLAGIFHLLNIFDAYLNFEYAFALVTEHWINPEKYLDAMGHYWHVQANPIGTSIVGYFFHKIFFIEVSEWSCRVITIFFYSTAVILLDRFISASKLLDEKSRIFLAVLILFNPLMWVFSGRFTTDVLPISSILIAFYFLSKSKKLDFYFFVSTLLFSLAVIIKFHSAFLGFLFLCLLFWRNNNKINGKFLAHSVLFNVIPIGSLLIYFLVIERTYGVWILPEHFKSMLAITPKNSLKTFFEYSYFSVVLLGPIALLPLLEQKNYKSPKFHIYLLFSFLLGLGINQLTSVSGEMNFSMLESYIPSFFIEVLKISGFTLFFLFLRKLALEFKENKTAQISVASWLPLLVILIFSRPAQRYLTFMIPFYVLFLASLIDSKKRIHKFLVIATLVVYLPINVMFVFYHKAQSQAVRKMTEHIQKSGMIEDIYPRALSSYNTPLFLNHVKTNMKSHAVYFSPRGNEILHEEPMMLFNKVKVKSLYLVKLNKPVEYIGR